MLPLPRIGKSFEMANAGPLAIKLALDRKAKSIGLVDFFSAVYLVSRGALIPYWRDEEELDRFVRESCDLTEPVWFYWIDFYRSMREDPRWRDGISVPYSAALVTILNQAANLAYEAARKSHSKPQLGVGHFVQALAAHPGLEFTRKMLCSGMNRHPPRGRPSPRARRKQK